MKNIRSVCMILALLVGTLALVPSAMADKVFKTDGTVVEGVISEETETYIWIVVKIGVIEKPTLITKSQIDRIERESPLPAGAQASKALPQHRSNQQPEARQTSASATKVVFIPLRDMVGTHMNASALRRSIDSLEGEDIDVVVLVITSGGGFVSEITLLSDVIHKEIKPKYRVVAWIETAISAACMTAWNCEEIYMTKQGNIGGAVAFTTNPETGKSVALEGDDLEMMLRMGEKISKRGKRDPLILRSMQMFTPLSCDIDQYGNVKWFSNAQGEFLINPANRILTFNSLVAEKFGISKATADTKEELMLRMGINEWVESGLEAHEGMLKFLKNVDIFEKRINALWAEYQMALQLAGGGDEELRKRGIGRARKALSKMRGLVRRAPSFEEYTIFTPEWFAQRDQELRDLGRGR